MLNKHVTDAYMYQLCVYIYSLYVYMCYTHIAYFGKREDKKLNFSDTFEVFRRSLCLLVKNSFSITSGQFLHLCTVVGQAQGWQETSSTPLAALEAQKKKVRPSSCPEKPAQGSGRMSGAGSPTFGYRHSGELHRQVCLRELHPCSPHKIDDAVPENLCHFLASF